MAKGQPYGVQPSERLLEACFVLEHLIESVIPVVASTNYIFQMPKVCILNKIVNGAACVASGALHFGPLASDSIRYSLLYPLWCKGKQALLNTIT